MANIDWAAIDGQALLRAIAPKRTGFKAARQDRIIADFGSQLPRTLVAYEITSVLRVAHFLAQICHESDGFSAVEEYSDGAAYEGRADLGNTKAGDGKAYKGRALPMVTGRANHREFTAWVRQSDRSAPDFEARPESLAIHPWAGLAAFWFWTTRGLNPLADRDDLVLITRRINGGLNGLADRRAALARAKAAIAALLAREVPALPDRPTLHRGSDSEAVADLQRALNRVLSVGLAVDGDFGSSTEAAVRWTQEFLGLVADGIVGPKTWAGIDKALAST